MIKKPIYDDDNLTPEEELALMAIPVPGARPTPPPAAAPVPMTMPQPQFTMNDVVRKKLMAQMLGNREVDNPYDVYNKASIDSAALSGIAGGMAQLGTVHGKTPDPSPYIQASQRMLDPLKQSAMQIEKERNLDPRILAYLTKNQPKASATPQTKLLPQRNEQGFYLEQDPTGQVKPSAIKGYNPPKDPKEPKPQKTNEADYRSDLSMQNAAKLKDLIDKHGTASVGVPGALMDKVIFELAIDFAKIADPDSVAREGEVAAAQKYMLPVRNWAGMRYTNDQAKKLVDNYMADLQARKDARVRNTPVTPGKTPPGGGMKMTPEDQQASDWAKKNSSDPRAAQILEKLGKKYGGSK
jgi:hypothetical protein